jgi:hypothetical protein
MDPFLRAAIDEAKLGLSEGARYPRPATQAKGKPLT